MAEITKTANSGAGSGLIAVGSLISAGSQIKSGKKEADSLRDLATQFITEGLLNARDFERQSSVQLASARAARSASGIDISSGSALMVDEMSIRNIAEGVSRIQEEAARRARAARREAKKAKRSGKFGAASTLLMGAATLATGGAAAALFVGGAAAGARAQN